MPAQKIIHNIQKLGLIDGGCYCLSTMLENISRGRCRLIRYYFVAQPVPHPSSDGLRPSSKCVVDFVKPDNPLVAAFPRPSDVIQKRFGNGHICIAAQIDETFAGFIWIAEERYDEDEVRCRYQLNDPKKSVWDFDVYVEPKYRVGRSLARLWNFANLYLAESGKLWTFSRIASYKVESLRSHKRLGTRTLFSATFLCIGNVQLTIATKKPFIHLSLSATTEPIFRFGLPEE